MHQILNVYTVFTCLYMLNHPLWLNKKKYLQFKTLKLEQTHKKL